MVRELMEDQSSEWIRTVRALPSKWTSELWRKAYWFPKDGEGMALRTDKFLKGKFTKPPHPKDGYSLSHCESKRVQRLLEFLVPILYPERPNRITITLANTIFGALSGDRMVNWGLIIRDLVGKLVGAAGKSKPSSLSPFLFHLYHSLELLRDRESTVYKPAMVMLKYDISPPPEPDEDVQREESGGQGSSERERKKEEKKVTSSNKGKGPVVEEEREDPVWSIDRKEDPLGKIITDLERIRKD